jgi:hypothetical protein
MGDRRKCQTYTASPAEPAVLPVVLEHYSEVYGAHSLWGYLIQD